MVIRGRPKDPLLSRDVVVRAALKIVDNEGLTALTTRRLAHDLGVKGPSLYNHFANKDEILAAAAEMALSEAPRRRKVGSRDAQKILVSAAQGFRDALMAHPNLLAAMVARRSLGFGYRAAEAVLGRLVQVGLPVGRAWLAMDALERWTIGWVTWEITLKDVVFPDEGEFPHLAAAMTTARSSNTFDVAAAAIVEALLEMPAGIRAGANDGSILH